MSENTRWALNSLISQPSWFKMGVYMKKVSKRAFDSATRGKRLLGQTVAEVLIFLILYLLNRGDHRGGALTTYGIYRGYNTPPLNLDQNHSNLSLIVAIPPKMFAQFVRKCNLLMPILSSFNLKIPNFFTLRAIFDPNLPYFHLY